VEHALHYASGNQLEILIYKNKIVDVTEFKDKHPGRKIINILGGYESIQKHIGKDITKEFDKEPSHNTKTAMKDLDDFCIGTIKLNLETSKPYVYEKDYKYDVDIKKGILWQVWTKLNKAQYLDFIHDPKHMISPPEAILFENPYLEFFTKTHWYVIPMLWLPVVFYYLFISYTQIKFAIPILVILYMCGIFLWTFTEYFLHRFVFHIDEKLPDNSFCLMLHFLLHGIHHAFPMDRNRLVFPPAAALPLYFLLISILKGIFGFIFPIITAGVLTGYIMYDLTHYFIHHSKSNLSYFKNLKQYHVLHHYNNPSSGFGVSNKIWDYVFNTVLVMKNENDKN
jgi:4-hydroxysphinganine ceramide fatty acyl 2-hydroxylase